MNPFVDLITICQQTMQGLSVHPRGLLLSLFLVGLAGSTTHCIGMCGPFVLGQVMADVERHMSGSYGEWRRLRGAALLPYHLGRMTTYTALGAIAGKATAFFIEASTFASLAAGFLVLASLLILLQALGLASGIKSPMAGPLIRLAGPLSATQGPLARYALGIMLGFLPCGLLYGALAVAAGTASASGGAAAMTAFALGTVPALVAVGWGGLMFRRRIGEVARWVSTPLLVVNAMLMLAVAGTRF